MGLPAAKPFAGLMNKLREAVGDDVDILVDFRGRTGAGQAIEYIRAVEDLHRFPCEEQGRVAVYAAGCPPIAEAGQRDHGSDRCPKNHIELKTTGESGRFGSAFSLHLMERGLTMLSSRFLRFLGIVGRVALLAPLAASALSAQDYVNAQLPWHWAAFDPQGRLLAWYHPEKNLGYDQVLKLGWDFIEHKVPADTRHRTGLKIYLINSVFDDNTLQGANWQHNPAMVFGTFVDSLVGWYPYSGDEEAVRTVREMLDHMLAHGTTPADWEWPGVPFPTNCDDQPDYGHCIQDMPREFYGGIETDKLGELGIGYVLFYEMTGERKYLEAALRCAQALTKHVRAGDAEHTPWPFRVNAHTGEVLAGEDYGGIVASCLRLFDELIRLQVGDPVSFQRARDTAWKWLLDYPLNRRSRAWDKWSGYFEDVPKNTENVNQAAPTYTAYYILARADPAAVDRAWSNHVGHLIDWVRQKLGRGPYLGAWAIDEQGPPPNYQGCCSRAGEGSDTSRWAAINAMYYEKTGDVQAREDAFRSLNYATYFAGSDGRVSCCGIGFDGQYWFSDGYSDYLRHFNWTMGAIPDFAPIGENHLLGSTSVVQKVSYGERSVKCRTFDSAATEVLRVNFKPARVLSGTAPLAERDDLKREGYTLQALQGSDYVVRVRHEKSNEVSVEGR